MALRLWQMEAIGVGTSATYAISLMLSGCAYWGVVLMQIVATRYDLWGLDAGGLRLAWMILTQSGFALQSFAYSKLLWMWLGYSRGVGKFVQPALPVSRWYDRFVGVFVTAVLLNYGAQLLIAAAFYDIAKADRADDGAAEPAGIAGVALKDLSAGLDLATEALWFAITLQLLLTIRTLRARELGEATRLELQQHNALVRTARVLFAVHFLAFAAQVGAFTPAGKGDGETIAAIVQIAWFIVQLWFQIRVMHHVYDTHLRSMAAFEAKVLRAATMRRLDDEKAAAADELSAARRPDAFCDVRSVALFAGVALLVAAVVATALFVGALLLRGAGGGESGIRRR